MKLLQIHDQDCRLIGPPPRAQAGGGGIGVYLTTVCNGLLDRGHDVAMIRYSPDGPLVGGGGYYQLRSGSQRLPAGGLDDLLSAARAESPDVIHLHSVYYAMHPRMIEVLLEHWPIVYTLHDVTPLCFRHTKLHPDGSLCSRAVGLSCLGGCYKLGSTASFVRDLFRVFNSRRHLRLYRRLPRLVVPSDYLRRTLIVNGFDTRRIQVLPQFSRVEPAASPPPSGGRRILYVGRLVREKGVLVFLHALAKLTTDDWTADIVGEGPLQREALDLAVQLEIEHRVRFHGPAGAEQLQHFYRAASLVVVPSLIPESFGLVGVEAMAFARPVVAFAAGGIPQWLEDGRTGLLAPHGDVPALAACIDRLLRDHDLAERLGTAGAQAVQARFTLDHHLDGLLAIYRSAAGRSVEVAA